MYDFMRRDLRIQRRYHQASQFLITNNARDMSRLANVRYIRRKDEGILAAMDSDLLRGVRDRDAQGAGEEYVVSVRFGKDVNSSWGGFSEKGCDAEAGWGLRDERYTYSTVGAG